MGVKQAGSAIGKQIGMMKVVMVEHRPIMIEEYGAQTVGAALDEYLAQIRNNGGYIEKVTLDLRVPRE